MSRDCQELIERLKITNKLLETMLPDPKIPNDIKGYIRSEFNINCRLLEGIKQKNTNG